MTINNKATKKKKHKKPQSVQICTSYVTVVTEMYKIKIRRQFKNRVTSITKNSCNVRKLKKLKKIKVEKEEKKR